MHEFSILNGTFVNHLPIPVLMRILCVSMKHKARATAVSLSMTVQIRTVQVVVRVVFVRVVEVVDSAENVLTVLKIRVIA